jgi:hypothetical protein
VAASCSGGDEPRADPATASTIATDTSTREAGTQAAANGSAESEAAGVVPDLLRFSAPLVGGGELNGAEYAGAAVAFWFWAPF